MVNRPEIVSVPYPASGCRNGARHALARAWRESSSTSYLRNMTAAATTKAASADPAARSRHQEPISSSTSSGSESVSFFADTGHAASSIFDSWYMQPPVESIRRRREMQVGCLESAYPQDAASY